MRKTKGIWIEHLGVKLGITLLIMIILGLSLNCFTLYAHAEASGKVTAQSANIRKEANSTSEVIGSTELGKTISIKSEVTGSDGMIWYQVYVDSNTLGFIRSDLVEKGEGTLESYQEQPATPAPTTPTPTTPETPVPSGPTVEVTPVQPQSATVIGGQIRVRSDADASKSDNIVTTLQQDVVLTVNGQATGTDGNIWYQVKFISNGSDVTGFVRADFVTLAGDLVPITDETPEEPPAEPTEPEVSEPPQVQKAFDTIEEGGEWFLVDNSTETVGKYKINDVIGAQKQNKELFENNKKTINSQKIWIIILVIILVGLILAVSVLVMKIKDIKDEAYFSAVEKQTIRERDGGKEGGSGKRVMHTVGTNQKAGQPTRPRPQGQSAQAGGQARPANQRPQGGQARPAGSKPANQRPISQRPVSQRPQGQEANNGNQAKPRPVSQPQSRAPQNNGRMEQPNPAWKSKNFMSDDEFEFEFLNFDDEK